MTLIGKQVGSVTAPRKIIDMDVVSPEGLDSTVQSVQRDSRKVKQLLLEVERVSAPHFTAEWEPHYTVNKRWQGQVL